MPAPIMSSHSLPANDESEKPENLPSAREVATRKSAMMMDRTVVARVESIFCRPSLPKMATRAAVKAERMARGIQDI